MPKSAVGKYASIGSVTADYGRARRRPIFEISFQCLALMAARQDFDPSPKAVMERLRLAVIEKTRMEGIE
ncbi:MAG: hypothetical protein NT159_02205 [Proteobacteria bacterium]|nr:hypothetical protein [Pseudomonadota bacterium]